MIIAYRQAEWLPFAVGFAIPGPSFLSVSGETERRRYGFSYGRLMVCSGRHENLRNAFRSTAHSRRERVYFSGSGSGSRHLMAGDIVVRPERFELPACCFGGNRSIQLSYGRTRGADSDRVSFPPANAKRGHVRNVAGINIAEPKSNFRLFTCMACLFGGRVLHSPVCL